MIFPNCQRNLLVIIAMVTVIRKKRTATISRYMDSDDDELSSPARLARREKYRLLKKQARLMRRRPYSSSKKLSIYDPLNSMSGLNGRKLYSKVKVGSSPPRKTKMMTTAFEKPCEGVVFIANGGACEVQAVVHG